MANSVNLSMTNLTIIGAGIWGSALSIALSVNFDNIYLICHNQQQADNLLPRHPALDVDFHKNIIPSADYSIIQQTDGVLIATPSYAFSTVLNQIKPHLTKQQIAWATKGFSNDNGDDKLLHQVFNKVLPNYNACAISGPSFAFEVASKKPTALVVATDNQITQDFWINAVCTDVLRTYRNNDIIGVEIGGSVKNILAIAAGLSVGLGFGANTMSALITRGLAEMTRLGLSLGAKQKTLTGLSGLGDLTLTCLDDLSRNRRFGKELAKNLSIEQALKNVGSTVEGLNALSVVLRIAKQNNIEMPICEQVLQVTNQQTTPKQAVNNLMQRNVGFE